MRIVSAEAIRDKRVLVRLDLDMPVNDDGQLTDVSRLTAALPTLQLLKDNAKQVVLCGHMGRPKGQVVDMLSLKQFVPEIEEYAQITVHFQETLDEKPPADKRFVLLENLRFWPGEDDNDAAFVQKLASFGDVYVYEAFGVAHRETASTVGVSKALPSTAGLRVAKEVVELSHLVHSPIEPFVIILGGAKIETKLPVIYHLEDHAQAILIGGLLAKEIADQKLTMPANCVVATIREDGLDIDADSIQKFKNIIKNAQTVAWNGPVGKFEDKGSDIGTNEVAQSIVSSGAYSVIGGGDTLAALHNAGLMDEVDFVSVGGGAMLEFLSGKELPAIKVLQ